MENETVWLNQQQLAQLLKTSRTNIVEHIRHIYEEEEPEDEAPKKKKKKKKKVEQYNPIEKVVYSSFIIQ